MSKYKHLENGAPSPRVEEPLLFGDIHQIQWNEPRVDLTELARLRWVEGLNIKELSAHFGRTENAIINYFQKIRKKGLSPIRSSPMQR